MPVYLKNYCREIISLSLYLKVEHLSETRSFTFTITVYHNSICTRYLQQVITNYQPLFQYLATLIRFLDSLLNYSLPRQILTQITTFRWEWITTLLTSFFHLNNGKRETRLLELRIQLLQMFTLYKSTLIILLIFFYLSALHGYWVCSGKLNVLYFFSTFIRALLNVVRFSVYGWVGISFLMVTTFQLNPVGKKLRMRSKLCPNRQIGKLWLQDTKPNWFRIVIRHNDILPTKLIKISRDNCRNRPAEIVILNSTQLNEFLKCCAEEMKAILAHNCRSSKSKLFKILQCLFFQ